MAGQTNTEQAAVAIFFCHPCQLFLFFFLIGQNMFSFYDDGMQNAPTHATRQCIWPAEDRVYCPHYSSPEGFGFSWRSTLELSSRQVAHIAFLIAQFKAFLNWVHLNANFIQCRLLLITEVSEFLPDFFSNNNISKGLKFGLGLNKRWKVCLCVQHWLKTMRLLTPCTWSQKKARPLLPCCRFCSFVYYFETLLLAFKGHL